MKVIKISLIIFLFLTITSSVIGYFYFDKKFTPKPNNLNVSGESGQIPIYWTSSSLSQRQALLLPVQIEGIKDRFYMQFDTGSPYTLFYKSSLDTIQNLYAQNDIKVDSSVVKLHLNIGNMVVRSDDFLVYDVRGNWTSNDSIKIIGTIGTDLMENRTTKLNFKDNVVIFDTISLKELGSEFKFKKRRILIPIKIEDKEVDVIFDTGTSAFEYITSKDIWEKLKAPSQKIDSSESNSMGRILKTYTTASNKKIHFQNSDLKLDEVTYIKGYSTSQYLMMKFSGMGGMLGNKLFTDKILTLDCQNQKYRLE